MTAAPVASIPAGPPELAWQWPIKLDRYDRGEQLSVSEREAIEQLGADLRRLPSYAHHDGRDLPQWRRIGRLLQPLDDAQAGLALPTRRHRRSARDAIAAILRRCAETKTTYWAWSTEDWVTLVVSPAAPGWHNSAKPDWMDTGARPYVAVFGYRLTGFDAFARLGTFNGVRLVHKIFVEQVVSDSTRQVVDVLTEWGYGWRYTDAVRVVLCQLFVRNRSPLLRDLSAEVLSGYRADPDAPPKHAHTLFTIQTAAATLGFCDPPGSIQPDKKPAEITGTSEEWARYVQRWYDTSTLTRRTRLTNRIQMAKVGRWLATEHPEIVEPGQWTRQICASWVAAVDRMRVGDYIQHRDNVGGRAGVPLAPVSKVALLGVTRVFFRDCQEWEWIPRRFDPATALTAPRSIKALLSTDPRVIADEVWAKLLSAGLNLTADDLPTRGATMYYPMELIRAITLTWLFAGLRSDEIIRLRVGCIRWQHDGFPIPRDSRDVLAADAVCLLDVPIHKTGAAFTKPVDPLLGQAIEAWQAIRPDQPTTLDRKTSEQVDLLLSTRARPIGQNYINRTLIPALCRKAGVPTTDVRGTITSHRARSTIASQLYNAKEPMTLFELQAWLGHRSPDTTQHYAKITPNTLAKAYRDAGYFARNIRTIEILVDRDAVTSGDAAAGQPWQHYDLGHGYCSYSFFEQCPHRMACAHCDFYTPKDSAKAQLLEAKTNLQRVLASIPLTDDEQAAVDHDEAALDALLARLADVATPAGPTPRQIGVPATATRLPITDIRHGKSE